MGRGSHTLQIWHRPGVRPKQPTTILELLDRVVVCPSGCWLFIGGESGNGYGRILRPGTRNAMAAHRYVFQTFKGEIPPGWHVDHLCRGWACDDAAAFRCRRCVNPEHLEAVPYLVNYARRDRDNGRAFDAGLIAAPAPAVPFRSIEEWRARPIDDPFE
jgi:hypothetical protein